jgi:hypothetical protein
VSVASASVATAPSCGGEGGRAPVDRSAQSQCVEPSQNVIDVADDTDDDEPAFGSDASGSDASSEASESPPPAPFHAPTLLQPVSAPGRVVTDDNGGAWESYALDGGTSVVLADGGDPVAWPAGSPGAPETPPSPHGGDARPRRRARLRRREADFLRRRRAAVDAVRRTYRCDRTACLADVPSPPALRRQHATVYRERLQIQCPRCGDWDDIDIFF